MVIPTHTPTSNVWEFQLFQSSLTLDVVRVFHLAILADKWWCFTVVTEQEIGSHYAAQAGPKLLGLSEPPASASQEPGITSACHRAWGKAMFLFLFCLMWCLAWDSLYSTAELHPLPSELFFFITLGYKQITCVDPHSYRIKPKLPTLAFKVPKI